MLTGAVAAGIGALGSLAAGAIAGSNASKMDKKSYQYNKLLQENQAQLNDSLAQKNMQRQYDYDLSSYSLDKASKMNAGVNTALQSGTTTAVGGNSAPASGVGLGNVQVHDPLPNIGQITGSVGNLLSQIVDSNKKEAETKGQQIDNLTKQAINEASLNKLIKDGVLTDEQAKNYKLQNQLLGSTLQNQITQSDLETQRQRLSLTQAENEIQLQDIQKAIQSQVSQLTGEQLRQARIQSKYFEKQIQYQLAEIAHKIPVYDAQSQELLSRAQMNIVEKELKSYQARLEAAKVPFASVLAENLAASTELALQNAAAEYQFTINKTAVDQVNTELNRSRTYSQNESDRVHRQREKVSMIKDAVDAAQRQEEIILRTVSSVIGSIM